MGAIREFIDFVGKLKFYEIVYSYQQGLYWRNGKPLEIRRRNISKKERENAWSKEKALIEKMGTEAVPEKWRGKRWLCVAMGYAQFLPFARPELPDGFVQSFWTGLPLHESRFSKILDPGLYLHVPILDDIVTASIQERVLNLGNINVLTSDTNSPVPMSISCNLRYKLLDFYKAYTAVHDYEASLKDHTLSILAKYSRGRTMADWQDSKKINELEEEVVKELRSVVTDSWGLKILKIYITDNVPSNTNRIVLDGHPISLKYAANVFLDTIDNG